MRSGIRSDYATGYLLLLLFIAGPLRRFGAFTIPDFAEGRFDSPTFRKIAVIFVLFIGFFYTMPQMKAAGTVMMSILGWPYAAGIVVVGAVITFNVALGGMKGITFVQAFQYWAKVFAISVPVFVLMTVYGGYNNNFAQIADTPKGAPKLAKAPEVKFKGKAGAPANVLAFSAGSATGITFPKGAVLDKVSPARKLEPGEDPLAAGALTVVQGDTILAVSPAGGWPSGFKIPAGAVLKSQPYEANQSGKTLLKDGKPLRNAAKIEFLTETSGLLAAGSPIPNAQANKKWSEPFGTLTGKYGHPLLYTYSLLLSLVCGTRRSAAHSGPFLYQSGRALRQADHALGHGSDRRLLPRASCLGSHRAKHPADPLCEQRHRQPGHQTPNGADG